MPYPMFLITMITSTVLDFSVWAAALFGGRWFGGHHNSTELGLKRVLFSGIVTTFVFIIKLVPLTALGLNVFGLIHFIYIDLLVIPPLAGATLLAVSWIRSKTDRGCHVSRPTRILAFAAFAAVPIGVYSSWIEPFRLKLETAEVHLIPARAGSSPIKVGVIADLQTNHVTAYERSAFDRLMAARPDLILLPGDLFQGSERELEANRAELVELLGRLSAPGGVFFVLGDVDQRHYQIEEIVRSAGITMLVNEVAHVTIGDRQVTIGGLELDPTTGGARGTVADLEDAPGIQDVRILVAHRPDVVLGLKPRSRIDLVVSGHTHGGQIVVPGFGPPMTLSAVPRPIAAGGLHSLDDNLIYVSRGVGCERGQAPRIRFLCPPEISLLHLQSEGSRKGSDSSMPGHARPSP